MSEDTARLAALLRRDDLNSQPARTKLSKKTMYQVRRYIDDGSEQIGGRLYSRKEADAIVSGLADIGTDAYTVPLKVSYMKEV